MARVAKADRLADFTDAPIGARGQPFLRFAKAKLNEVGVSGLPERLAEPFVQLSLADAQSIRHNRQPQVGVGVFFLQPLQQILNSL